MWRVGQGVGWAVALFAFHAQAQSISIDRDEPAPHDDTAPRATKKEQSETPAVTPPKALSTPVEYPAGAQGGAEVVLELVVLADGSVSDVSARQGPAPFADAAVRATRTWRFTPAQRGGKPVAARIRFAVSFTEPESEPPADSEAPAEPVPAGDPKRAPTSSTRTGAPIDVLVEGERPETRQRLGRAEVREMPGAFGDPFRAIEALPGVVPIVSGLPYFYVRGAPPGNVGYFFDGIPVPVLYHFAAGPGVLHPAFVDHVDLYAGAYPARYGRFAGGIVAGEMAPPSYELRGEASIRLIDSGAMVETPFSDGAGSVMLGGRFSYTAALLSLIVPEVTVNYWDYQGRLRYRLDADDSVEVLLFGSGDFVSQEDTEDGETREQTLVDIGFHRLDLRWDRALSEGNWRHALMLGLDNTDFADGDVDLTGRLLGARSELELGLSDTVRLRAGADVLLQNLAQTFDVGDESDDVSGPDPGAPPANAPVEPAPDPADGDPDDIEFDLADRNELATGVRADLVIDAAPGVEVTPGLRVDLFISGRDYSVGVDPRINARFKVGERTTLLHGLGLTHQTPSFIVPIPGFQLPLGDGLQRAVQHSAGVEHRIGAEWQASLVLFHNVFFEMTDFLGIARFEPDVDDFDELRSQGRSYGAELMLRRSLAHKLGGFVSYTLGRSERSLGRFEGPATTDRTHVLNVAASYDLGRDWRAGGRFLFYTGIPPEAEDEALFGALSRTRPFWRLDIRVEKRWWFANRTAWWALVLEVLNTTLNHEVLTRQCSSSGCEDDEIGPVTIPSLGVQAAF